ncbi:hypothetical protein I4U23_015379 [Adineta vaga]|nr:hypothetical protein I4U23_015379 [Adineta vaga]
MVESIVPRILPSSQDRVKLFSPLLTQSVPSSINSGLQSSYQNKKFDFHANILPRNSNQFMDSSKTLPLSIPSRSICETKTSTNTQKSFSNSSAQSKEQQLRKTKRLKHKRSKSSFSKVKTIRFNQTGTKENMNPNLNRKVRRLRSRYCCLASIIIAILLAIGLAGILAGLFVKRTITTVTTTTSSTTTSTTSETTTTTTSATTTTTTSTSTTTSETTSTTTTETTSTVTTTTTSVTTTSSTSTSSSTSSTSSTSTTTANPCGTPINVGSSSLFSSTTFSFTSYTCCYAEWIASTTGSVNLVFQFRSNIDHWYLDDVTVTNGTTELLVNGGFEYGSFSPGWTRSIPNGACQFSSGSQVMGGLARTGSYRVDSWCANVADEISQSFFVTTGQSYSIRFCLKVTGTVASRMVSVTLS